MQHDDPQDNIPIGHLMPGMAALVLGPDLQEVDPGESGELWLSGPQITRGYLDDEARTNEVFRILPGRDERHYRTGDLVVRPRGDDPFIFMGRVDQQVQIRGHRVELLEIEHVLCSHDSVMKAAVIGWPEVAPGSVDGVVAFVEGPSGEGALDNRDLDQIRTYVAARLPDYMCPRQIKVIDQLPLNVNGKTDRSALKSLLRDH